jgi:hypothetical protein
MGGTLRGGREASSLIVAGLVVVIVVGLFRSIYLIYSFAKKLSERLLEHSGTLILEVS